MLTSFVTEWETAFCVAVEVLNSGRQTYHLLPHSKPSGCNWETAQIGTYNMLAKSTATKPPLVGVVGPACTVAAMSAAIVLADEDYPLISFAATGEPLSNRDTFPTFLRTV
jgi:hypothetical protein